MTVKFYSVTDDPKKITKTLGTVKKTVSNIKPFDPVALHDPVLVLNYDSTYYGVNYASVEDGSKTWYYFVDEPVVDTSQRASLQLHLDLLMTNKDEILNLDVILERSSTSFNSYMYDPKQQGEVSSTIYTIPFPGHLGTGNTFEYNGEIYVAAIGGGGVAPL